MVARLEALAIHALCDDWRPTRSLASLPAELAKLIYAELKARAARDGAPLACAALYPFVRDVWLADALDLSDSGRWVTATSLGALGYLRSLRTVRLAACKFVGDDALGFLQQLPVATLDLSWTQVGDGGAAALARCPSLTSLNLTGLAALSDRGAAALLPLTALRRLSLCATGIGDAALDYLTYYQRYAEAATGAHGFADLEWLELSNTALTDTGVGKLVAIVEKGVPYGKVFKKLQYLALSMTGGVTPAAVRQVRVKYGFDTPLPNAQRTLAASNAVALEARDWVLRINPHKEQSRERPAPPRTWEQARQVGYVAQWTKEMAGAQEALARGGPPPPPEKRQRT